jgi:hypothetical protein
LAVRTKLQCPYCPLSYIGPDALEYHTDHDHPDQLPFKFDESARQNLKKDVEEAYAAWGLARQHGAARQANASVAVTAGTQDTLSIFRRSLASGSSEVNESFWFDKISEKGWHNTNEPYVIAYTDGDRWTHMQSTKTCEYFSIPEIPHSPFGHTVKGSQLTPIPLDLPVSQFLNFSLELMLFFISGIYTHCHIQSVLYI